MSVEKANAWLRKAESDLLSADNNLSAAQIPFDVVCYHCQQATEKHLKALLVFLDVQPPLAGGCCLPKAADSGSSGELLRNTQSLRC